MNRQIAIDTTVSVEWEAGLRSLRSHLLDIICDDPETRTVRLTTVVAGTEMTRLGTVEVGELRTVDRHTATASVRWEADEHARRFPTVEGMLELSGLSEHPPLSRLAFLGEHHAPLGLLGTLGDAAGGLEMGRDAARLLLERAAERLAAAVKADAAALDATASASSRGPVMMRVDLDD